MASHNPILASKAPDSVLSKLVDPQRGCSPVYSLHAHEQFGYVIGAFIVEHNSTGGLSLRAQRLLPENIVQFSAVLDEADRQLVQLLSEITLQQLYKKFGQGIGTLQQFLKKYGEGQFKDYITRYIHQRILEAISLLPGKMLFVMGKDGYPAGKPVQIADNHAKIVFDFNRTTQQTYYRVKIKLGEEHIPLHEHPGAVLTDEPVWILSGDTVFRFADPVEGKKLQPFFKRDVISIPREREAEYYEKFLLRLLEYNEVQTYGIDIRDFKEQPAGFVALEDESPGRLRLRLVVKYGNLEVAPGEGKLATVHLDTRNTATGLAFTFTRTLRDTQTELRWKEFMLGFRPAGHLVDPSFTIQEAYDWLLQHADAVAAVGLQLVQHQEGPKLSTKKLSVQFRSKPTDAGYQLDMAVRNGDAKVPLATVREAILKGRRDVKCPDGALAFLPEAWLEDYRHLLEVAQVDNDSLLLTAAQVALLPEVSAIVQRNGKTNGADGGKNNGKQQATAQFESIQAQALPNGLKATLRDYQQAGYDWLCFLKDYNLGGILADDMGLGKTLQTLAFLLREKEQAEHNGKALGPSLIVVPNSLLYNWVAEAAKFTPALRTQVYSGNKTVRSEQSLFNCDLLITTYGMVRQDVDRFAGAKFHAIVLDESQFIKNRDAKTTQAVLRLQASFKLSLSGTPIENSTLDLWTQMQFACPGLLGGEGFFERYYAIPIEKENNMARAHRLRKLIKPLVLRRTKEQVAGELPPLVEQIQYCEMTPDQRAIYDNTREEFRKIYFAQNDADFERSKMQILASLQRLRQIAIHPAMLADKLSANPEVPAVLDSGKYDAVWTILRDIMAQNRKVLVFSQFVKFLTLLRADLDKEKIPYSYLDGGLDSTERAAEIEAFQQDDKRQLFLISLKAGGVGLNLTAAEYVLLVDPWWNPAVERQALSRAHRIGQTKTVFVNKFITQGSIEEKILRLQEQKERLAGEIIRSEEQFFKSLTRDDLKALFD